MAQAPLEIFTSYGKIKERRSSRGFSSSWGSSDQLYRASRQTDQRRYIYDLNGDIHRNISAYGRRTLVTLGKWLYANNAVIRGVVNDMAFFSIGTWIAQYYGANPAWGNQAESWLFEHDKICDIAGGNMLDYLENLIRAVYVEGDCATVLTERNGYPLLQIIPGHRISSEAGEAAVEGGPFDGAALLDGVILDDYGGAQGYRILTANGFEDFPANDVLLHFFREYPNQVRGLSQLACSVFDWQDIREANDLELAAQKLTASIGLLETNETGDVDATKKLLRAPSAPFNSDNSKNASYGEIVDGVAVRYFRAGANCSLEEFKSQRPSVNGQEYRKQVMRECLAGLGWNIDFALDPTKVGGAPMRICVEKINKTIDRIQKKLAKPASARFNGFRLRKAIKLGQLADDPDWWKFDYLGPAKLTADEKYSSDVGIQEVRAGLKSPKTFCAERQAYWEDVQDEMIAWEKRLQERAKAEGVDPNRLVQLTPNGNAAITPAPAPEGQ